MLSIVSQLLIRPMIIRIDGSVCGGSRSQSSHMTISLLLHYIIRQEEKYNALHHLRLNMKILVHHAIDKTSKRHGNRGGST